MHTAGLPNPNPNPKPRPNPQPKPKPNPNPNQVHTAGLPKALMADLVRTVGNRTLLFMGDSVMEQVRVRAG